MSQSNAFGHTIPTLNECIASERLRQLLVRQLVGVLPGGDEADTRSLAEELLRVTSEGSNDHVAAHVAQGLLTRAGARAALRERLAGRSDRILEQIATHLIGSVVLDYGCGDGEVGRRVHERGYAVSACDVMDYRTEAARKLPWHLIVDQDTPSIESTFSGSSPSGSLDTLLVLTVLHHCSDPLATLRTIARLAPRRIISIESVYSLSADDVSRAPVLSRPGTSSTAEALEWLALTPELQFCYACFWDWFYNKVVNTDVAVPYNFSSPDMWSQRWRDAGYAETVRVYLGIDQPLVPEFHILQVLDRVDQRPNASRNVIR